MSFEKIFPKDKISKRERVVRTLRHQELDRAALHDQVSYNTGVIKLYNGNCEIPEFGYGAKEIGNVIRRSLDMCFPIFPPKGHREETLEDGLTYLHEEWRSSIIKRPFDDEDSAAKWLKERIFAMSHAPYDPVAAREAFRQEMTGMQQLVGESVICYHHDVGLCYVWSSMGLELFSFFSFEYEDLLEEFLELYTIQKLRWIHDIADSALTPVILLADDFATKQGSIFNTPFLQKHLFSHVKRQAEAWHEHDVFALYHSDGNWRNLIPELIAMNVDGFYCLEKSCNMDAVEFRNSYPEVTWAGGIDGVNLMERGTPEEVRVEVMRHILSTEVLHSGGMFIDTSSEINPPIKPENYLAMVNAVDECRNEQFKF